MGASERTAGGALPTASSEKADRTATRVLEMVGDVARELRGEPLAEEVRADSELDGELGLDSLARTELILRLQNEFAVELPDDALLSETPRELIAAVLGSRRRSTARPRTRSQTRSQTPSPGQSPAIPALDRSPAVRDSPRAASTLMEVFDWHLERHDDRRQILLHGADGELSELSYGELHRAALRVAGGLRTAGVGQGDTVVIMLPTGFEYFFAFLGILYAGGVPVPIYPPARREQAADHVRRHRGILANANCRLLVTDSALASIATLLETELRGPHAVVGIEALLEHEPVAPSSTEGDALALLQYTSGSTGQPKGVALGQDNLLANIRAMGKRVEVSDADVFVSWLPLYHDMGLIGAWLGTAYFGCPLVLMSPLRFLSDPARWLWAISDAQGTLSAAPNFGYELCLNKVSDERLEGLDLSSWRYALNGAEPVSPRTVRRFTKRFAAYGLPATAMTAVYGLAESSLGLTIPAPGDALRIDRIDREAFQRSAEVRDAGGDDGSDEQPLEFVACGRPLEGQEVRIAGATGHELPECREGLIEFRGPSSTRGYYRNSEATSDLFRDSWLTTGDRGYLRDGQLYVTGRVKDVIIRGGRNIHPTELDAAIGEIEGIRKGCVAAFGDAGADGRELLVVVAETAQRGPDKLKALETAIRRRTAELLNLPPDRVLLVPPHSVLKTSSGKIRRAETRELYRRGRLGRRPAARWRTSLDLVRLALQARVHRAASFTRTYGYSAWAWTLLSLLGAATWIGVLLAPTLGQRWSVVRGACRAYLRCAGVRLDVDGIENLPRGGNWALVANHTSYLDSMMLVVAVPHDLRFVAKSELRNHFVAGIFLRRLETIFVERNDPRRGATLADTLTEALEAGSKLVVFPEGTFFRAATLLPFHMGVFLAAAQSGRPVVPVTLAGVRDLLRSESWLLRRGAVSLDVQAPQNAAGTGWEDAVELRRSVTEAVRGALGPQAL